MSMSRKELTSTSPWYRGYAVSLLLQEREARAIEQRDWRAFWVGVIVGAVVGGLALW